MRVLFYLPVVTPWWFETIVTPFIRLMAKEAEVHVLVPTFWSGTGIGPTQLAACTDLDHVHWHIMDGEESRTFRVSAANCPELLDFVHRIAPDYSFCRSADFETPARFPGKVRYIMEGTAPPFEMLGVTLTPQPFDHGCLPDLKPDEQEWLAAAISPAWQRMHERFANAHSSREANLATLGLPTDKRIIALPLEYEHHENFFSAHRAFMSNSDMIRDIAAGLDSDEILAVTNHPLNDLYVDPTELHASITTLAGRALLIPNTGRKGETTDQLIRNCHGVIVELSKVYAVAGFFGTPMFRNSPFRTGDWLRSFDGFDDFLASLRAGERRGAVAEDAQVWFGFHFANEIIDPRRADTRAIDIIERVEKPVDSRRWADGIDRFRERAPALFA